MAKGENVFQILKRKKDIQDQNYDIINKVAEFKRIAKNFGWQESEINNVLQISTLRDLSLIKEKILRSAKK